MRYTFNKFINIYIYTIIIVTFSINFKFHLMISDNTIIEALFSPLLMFITW